MLWWYGDILIDALMQNSFDWQLYMDYLMDTKGTLPWDMVDQAEIHPTDSLVENIS